MAPQKPRKYGLGWGLTRGILKKGADGRQAEMATTRRHTAALLHLGEERHDPRGVNAGECHARGWLPPSRLGEQAQEAEGVARGTDRGWARLPRHQARRAALGAPHGQDTRTHVHMALELAKPTSGAF
jgi:hypothetical protein